MLNLFRKPKTTLTLDAGPETLLPGGRVELKVTVGGDVDEKAEGLRLGVRCVNEFKARERDSDGDMRTVTRKETVYEDIRDAGGGLAAGSYSEAFELPSRRDVTKCVITKETITRGLKPTLVTSGSGLPDEELAEESA